MDFVYPTLGKKKKVLGFPTRPEVLEIRNNFSKMKVLNLIYSIYCILLNKQLLTS